MGKVGCDIWEKWVRWAKKTNPENLRGHTQRHAYRACGQCAHLRERHVGGIICRELLDRSRHLPAEQRQLVGEETEGAAGEGLGW